MWVMGCVAGGGDTKAGPGVLGCWSLLAAESSLPALIPQFLLQRTQTALQALTQAGYPALSSASSTSPTRSPHLARGTQSHL